MSDRTDTLLLELLDAVRAQRSALEEGDTDKALALLPIRHGIIQEIQEKDSRVPESRRSTLKQILAVDLEITALVRHQMSDVASRLDGVDKLKRFFRNAASPLGSNDGVVA